MDLKTYLVLQFYVATVIQISESVDHHRVVFQGKFSTETAASLSSSLKTYEIDREWNSRSPYEWDSRYCAHFSSRHVRVYVYCDFTDIWFYNNEKGEKYVWSTKYWQNG